MSRIPEAGASRQAFVVRPLASLLGIVMVAAGWNAGEASRRFPSEPPARHTGGFGEPTCAACHFGELPDDPRGALELRGVPGRYTPGELYVLTVRLRHPELAAAGFQIAVRTVDGLGGEAAGLLEAIDERAATVPHDGTTTYLSQTGEGSAATDSASWTVQWTAPRSGEVFFNLSGNAADGDESPFGDFIYSLEQRSLPRP